MWNALGDSSTFGGFNFSFISGAAIRYFTVLFHHTLDVAPINIWPEARLNSSLQVSPSAHNSTYIVLDTSHTGFLAVW